MNHCKVEWSCGGSSSCWAAPARKILLNINLCFRLIISVMAQKDRHRDNVWVHKGLIISPPILHFVFNACASRVAFAICHRQLSSRHRRPSPPRGGAAAEARAVTYVRGADGVTRTGAGKATTLHPHWLIASTKGTLLIMAHSGSILQKHGPEVIFN